MLDFELHGRMRLAFVAVVPPRKNTTSSANGADQGWRAWITAVPNATAIPSGVRDFRDQARYTSAATAGTAMIGFIFNLTV